MIKKPYILILKLFLAAVPVWLLIIYYVIEDPFKVLYEHNEYYTTESRELFINRDHVSTSLYLKNYPKYNYDSFIFGSSRSFAFSVKEWQKYISSPAFHFDAYNESLFGLYTKVKYLSENNRPLKNCLIIIDPRLLYLDINQGETHLIKDPVISGESSIIYQYKFLSTFLTGGFFVSYLNWRAGSLLQFLDFSLIIRKWYYTEDYNTNDMFYTEHELAIKENKEKFFNELSDSYYDKDSLNNQYYPHFIEKEQFGMLKEIKKNLSESGTNYKIVLYPEPNEKAFDKEDVNILNDIFGKENIYNYSGSNEITKNKENYIDNIHVRHIIGDRIMKEIYEPTDKKVEKDNLSPN